MDMFQIRNYLNEDKTDVIFYKDTTIDHLFDVVDRERKNSYAVYHWLTQSKTYMNWLPGHIQLSSLYLAWSHVIIEKIVAQVGPTEGTIYNV